MAGPAHPPGKLAPESDVLSPLPAVLHQGLTGVAVLASISFVAATVTVLYLTFKLARWHIRARRRKAERPQSSGVDLSLGLEPRHLGHSDGQNRQHGVDNARSSPNQFLVLLYNLLIADMHQAGTFLINGVWVHRDTIQVGSPACFIQGWLISTGDMSGGLFLSAIAIHTYLAVVRNYKPPQWAIYWAVSGIWVFTYFMSALGIAITHNGNSGGGYFVRAGPWCWISVKYENMRLLTHYLFIFMSLAVVSVLYTLIFLHLRRRQNQNQNGLELSQSRSRLNDDQSPSKSSLDFRTKDVQANASSSTRTNGTPNGHHPSFLIYPVIYVVCTAPLALGRIATMAGATVPLGYFCAAGALITSNGWLDVILWGLTRRVLLFESDIDAEDVGLETFAFMRTPPGRQFGNMVWVQGASRGVQREAHQGQQGTEPDDARDGFDWWGWRRVRSGRKPSGGHHRMASLGPQARGHRRIGSRSISQESLRGRGEMAIQMDVVTTVEVEMDVDKMGSRHREESLSSNPDNNHQHYDAEHNLKFMHDRGTG